MQIQVLTNAHFHTLDPIFPEAETLVIQDERILAVGNPPEITVDIFPGAEVIDLQGMSVMPAFTDAHIHLLEYGLSLCRVPCETATKTECLQRVKGKAQATQPGRWIRGHGWNHNIWAKDTPDKTDLDDISPLNPVYLTHKSLHSAWVNTAALNAAGISRNSVNPEGGVIGRTEDGEPDGILYESAMRLVENIIPKPDQEERQSALFAAQTELHRFGISSVHDFDIWECYQTLADMQSRGSLSLRVVKNIPLPNLDKAIDLGITSGTGSNWLGFGWLKLFADGALGPQTAAMLAPYEESNSTGMLLIDQEEIFEIGLKALSAGISLTIHAIGDRANREVLNAYTRLNDHLLFSKTVLQPRIEHVQLISQEDQPRLANLGIIASMQPIHAVSDRDMADRHWGIRCKDAYPWNSILQSGSPLVFGSDAPVESPNPFWGLHAAVSRSSLGNESEREVWFPCQRIGLYDALRAYITTPGKIAGHGMKIGSLKPGFFADLVVIPADIFSLPIEEVKNVLPVAAMINGEWLFR